MQSYSDYRNLMLAYGGVEYARLKLRLQLGDIPQQWRDRAKFRTQDQLLKHLFELPKLTEHDIAVIQFYDKVSFRYQAISSYLIHCYLINNSELLVPKEHTIAVVSRETTVQNRYVLGGYYRLQDMEYIVVDKTERANVHKITVLKGVDSDLL